jgi:hypothetical protein
MIKKPVLAVALAVILASCTRPGASQISQSHVTPQGWQTICLGRLLVDLPAPVEIGAAEPLYHGPYGFQGINDLGRKGIAWGKVKIDETRQTTSKGYLAVFDGVAARMASAEEYAANFRQLEEKIRDLRKDTAATPGLTTLEDLLADDERELVESRHSFKVSGKARLPDQQAFAFRRGNEYTVGYFDLIDQRARVFEGPITQPRFESPEAAAFEYRRFRQIYHRRAPTDIPATSGFCTPFGFIDEEAGAEQDTTMEVPFRSAKYPNLIFTLTLVPTHPDGKTNIQELPNMGADRAPLDVIGIKGKYGPKAVSILGSPGRTIGFEYGPNCSRSSCRPADQAYAFEAQTFGEAGRVDRPNLTLNMTAVTSDDYKLKRTPQPEEPSYTRPDRPALSGLVPPTYDEGVKIFQQVLASIRLRSATPVSKKVMQD